VGKLARKRPTALASRSGLWLIGGALLFSAAVLAWAFQSDAPARPVHKPRPQLAARDSGGFRDHGDASGALPGRSAPKGQGRFAVIPETPGLGSTLGGSAEPRAPSASEYARLLEGNAFRPRIVPRRAGGSGASAHPAARKPAPRPVSDGNGSSGGPDAGGWHGWKFDGIAQLDQQTYALMDQPNQKQSRFVKEGDRLEDATIAQVSENQVVLRQADGSVVRVPRVDAMAELLRPGRTATPLPQGAVPALTGPAAGSPIPGQGPVTTPLGAWPPTPGVAPPATLPAPFQGATAPEGQRRLAGGATPGGRGAAVEGVSPTGSGGRRGRRFRLQDGAGDTGGQ
jgi:hypothetical protein